MQLESDRYDKEGRILRNKSLSRTRDFFGALLQVFRVPSHILGVSDGSGQSLERHLVAIYVEL
jgi:hypothetical protein